MIRHIFIAPIKDGISEEKLNKEISLLKAMKDNIPEIINLTIGKNTAISGVTEKADYPDGILESGEVIIKAGDSV